MVEAAAAAAGGATITSTTATTANEATGASGGGLTATGGLGLGGLGLGAMKPPPSTPSTSSSSPAAPAPAIAGSDRVDWVFHSRFERGGAVSLKVFCQLVAQGLLPPEARFRVMDYFVDLVNNGNHKPGSVVHEPQPSCPGLDIVGSTSKAALYQVQYHPHPRSPTSPNPR